MDTDNKERKRVPRSTKKMLENQGTRVESPAVNPGPWRARRAFTLIEMLVVMGIIAILMVLVAPAFTTLKSAGDVTSAAYTIKGVLDTARTYAMANNTYTWVGFLRKMSRQRQQTQLLRAPEEL